MPEIKKLLSDRILVKPIIENISQGGVIIPERAQKATRGEVIAVGPGFVNDKGQLMIMEVGVGDVVIFEDYVATQIEFEGNNYLMLREPDILAKEEKDEVQ